MCVACSSHGQGGRAAGRADTLSGFRGGRARGGVVARAAGGRRTCGRASSCGRRGTGGPPTAPPAPKGGRLDAVPWRSLRRAFGSSYSSRRSSRTRCEVHFYPSAICPAGRRCAKLRRGAHMATSALRAGPASARAHCSPLFGAAFYSPSLFFSHTVPPPARLGSLFPPSPSALFPCAGMLRTISYNSSSSTAGATGARLQVHAFPTELGGVEMATLARTERGTAAAGRRVAGEVGQRLPAADRPLRRLPARLGREPARGGAPSMSASPKRWVPTCCASG